MHETLITGKELASNLGSDAYVVVDCRFALSDTASGRKLYAESHIPGAYYAHLDDDLSGEIAVGKSGRHPLPPIDQVAQLFGSWGIDDTKQVVAYDQGPGALASRLWWMLNWLGHEAVAVLDGGFADWEAAGYPTDAENPTAKSATFTPRRNSDLTATAAQVESMSAGSDSLLIDSRGAARYRGEEEPIDPIAGHIPSAVNAPFAENLNDGRFRSKEELADRFDGIIGTSNANDAVFYCGSGVTACHNLLAMKHAGKGMAKLFPGSWSEWITDDRREIATG